MIAKASVKFVRISPRKVRYVIDRIRRKSVWEAQGILNGSPRRAADIVRKLLNQAVDAAEKNSQVKSDALFISSVMADGGPMMKRFRAASMGRGMEIHKRTSHIYLELDSKTPLPVSKKEKPAAPQAKSAPKKAASKKLVGAK
ncbi:MAG: 50S ribosomal protein L22 [Candidatus Omnitrophica bacterium]|nr:50S ribosomal protein L22 [Candidatus Omnitrophota bacterium]